MAGIKTPTEKYILCLSINFPQKPHSFQGLQNSSTIDTTAKKTEEYFFYVVLCTIDVINIKRCTVLKIRYPRACQGVGKSVCLVSI